MREITLDTETTGLDPASGHRIVEIACVEMHNRIKTGKTFHSYINPEREVPEEAFRIHGIATEFLQNKPLFGEIAEKFIAFIGDDPLVIHNAQFDMKFINYELAQVGLEPLAFERTTDTVMIARKKFPGSPANLDALCKRFNVDLSARTKHGALLDAELLADVYLELTGGRQAALILNSERVVVDIATAQTSTRQALPARAFPANAEELAAHAAMVEKIKNALWLEEA